MKHEKKAIELNNKKVIFFLVHLAAKGNNKKRNTASDLVVHPSPAHHHPASSSSSSSSSSTEHPPLGRRPTLRPIKVPPRYGPRTSSSSSSKDLRRPDPGDWLHVMPGRVHPDERPQEGEQALRVVVHLRARALRVLRGAGDGHLHRRAEGAHQGRLGGRHSQVDPVVHADHARGEKVNLGKERKGRMSGEVL